jgi:glycosyltransferase involved in cell wall biosynthesis
MKISVYITSFNQKNYLIEAIDSVLQQSFQPHQIIVVDDCSQDGSQSVIAEYARRYPNLFTPIYHLSNQGVSQTRIDALCAVTGDFVTYLDGDDRYLPRKLEQEAKLILANPNAEIAYSNYYYINECGTRTGVWVDGEQIPQGDVFQHTFTGNFPKGYFFRYEMVNYKAWKSVGFYDPNLNLREDDEMRIRLTKHLCSVANYEPLSEYRYVHNGLSKTKYARYFAVAEYIYRKNLSLVNDLSFQEREAIKKAVCENIAGLARLAVLEELADSGIGKKNQIAALKYCLKSLKYQHHNHAYILMLKALLPIKLYSRLKAIIPVSANKVMFF